MTVALNGLLNLSRIPEALVVGSSRVQMLSLTEIRRPSTRDFGFPVKFISSVSYEEEYCASLRGHTLLPAPVCLLHTIRPLPQTGQWCYECIETACVLISDAFLCFSEKGHLGRWEGEIECRVAGRNPNLQWPVLWSVEANQLCMEGTSR